MLRRNNETVQIQIRFVTKQQQYSVPNYPLLVHSSIDSDELNTLINELLIESRDVKKKRKFNFFVFSEHLCTTLGEHIARRKISSKEIIDVEYMERNSSPEPQDYLMHDDWVSTVAVCDKWILTGCYDNTLHIWTLKGNHHLVIPGHTSPIKSVAWISVSKDNASFVSASQDQTAAIWDWDITKNSVECVYICKGHEKSLEAVSVNSDETLMATGGWDTTLKIWSASTSDEQEDEESKPKKAKTEQNRTRIPKRTLKGHKDAITATRWSDKTEIVTCSRDHTVKIWDSEVGNVKCEMLGDKSYLDVDYSSLTGNIITASADKHVRLYDPRSSEGTVKTIYSSHTQWVQCVSWSTMNEYRFLSGGYDNIVKLWDTRSPMLPLFDLTGHEDKILCCSWSNPTLIVSGSVDNTLRIFKSKCEQQL